MKRPTGHLSPQEEVVQRALHRVAVGLLALNLLLTTGRVIANPGAYQPWFAAVLLVALWALLLHATFRCVTRTDAGPPLVAILLVGCLALLGHPWFEGSAPVAYPPMLHVLGAVICVSAVAGVRLSAILIPGFSTYVAVLRGPTIGWRHSVTEALLLAVSAYVATGAVDVLHRANRSVASAVRATAAAAEDRLRALRRGYERERWNGLVHDKVLGALRIASAGSRPGTPAAARELAEQALGAFHGDPLSTATAVAEELRDHATGLGLALDARVTEDEPDADLRETFIAAAKEALSNVSRHSGATSAVVVGSLGTTRAELTVYDAGAGFDARDHPAGVGINSSIVGRVRSLGGTATVSSRPGRGTVVQLRWLADQPASSPAADWQLRTFTPLMTVGAVALVLNVVSGAGQWLDSRSPALAVGGIIAIAILTVAVTLLDPAHRGWILVPLVAVALCLLLAINIGENLPADWRYWFIGALTPAVGAIAFRFRPWAGPGTAVAMILAVCAVDALSGRSPWSCLTGPVPVLLGTAAAGHLIRAAMNSAWQRVAAQDAARARLRLAAAVDEERSRETAARVRMLAGTVGPDLRLIASGAELTADDRHRMSTLEGAARDHLAAPELLNSQLVLALSTSRQRGVRVDIVPAGSAAEVTRSVHAPAPDRHVLDTVAGYRRVLVVVLEEAPPQARVRAVWRQSTDAVRGSVSVVCVSADRLAERIAHRVVELPVVPCLTSDEDSLLVEVSSSGT